jgi:hypothetical protein
MLTRRHGLAQDANLQYKAHQGSELPVAIVRHCSNRFSNTYRLALSMRWGLKTKGGLVANNISGKEDGVALRDTVPFELRGFSLPLVVFSVGAALTATSLPDFSPTAAVMEVPCLLWGSCMVSRCSLSGYLCGTRRSVYNIADPP